MTCDGGAARLKGSLRQRPSELVALNGGYRRLIVAARTRLMAT